MSITTILQTYKRPNYLLEQIELIKNQSVPSERLIIVHNEGGVPFDFPEDIEVIHAKPNQKYHLRFAIGLLLKTDYVLFFDDDSIPGVNWYLNCINTIEKHDCLCGTNGRLFVPEIGWTGPGWCTQNKEEVEVDFVGHAWFLKTKNLKYMFYDEIMEFENGEDIMLSANLQKYAGIKTYVPPHPKDDTTLWGSLKLMKYGSDEVLSWIVNKSHGNQRNELIQKYINKGWNLLNLKN